ncbi:riboflavin kinase [Coemansia sp. IMI 203386]|nr:riboflavin kinase [Coemansia sp. IMI 203386]
MDTTVSTDPNNITSGRPLLVGPSQPEPPYPIFVSGNVVQGFGRGGKQLGIPTANLPESAVAAALQNIPIGVYYGWAQVQHGEVRPMVMSLGWNPYFKNEKRSGEVHIIHGFAEDFYGQEMRVAILGFVREEKDYKSLEDLVADIRFDIRVALKSLEREAYLKIKDDQFFQKLVG